MNYNRATIRAKQLKSFYKNCICFAVIAGIILVRNFIRYWETDHAFQGSLILTIWAIILIIKAINLFIFGPEWEDKIIEEELKG